MKLITCYRRFTRLSYSLPPRYAQSVGAKHYDTSAKLDKGVSDMMLDLTKRKFVGNLDMYSIYPFCVINFSHSLILLLPPFASHEPVPSRRRLKIIPSLRRATSFISRARAARHAQWKILADSQILVLQPN